MTTIPARAPYTPPQLGREYNAAEIRTALGNLARSVSPMTTRNVSAATEADVTDDLIVCDTTGGNFAVTLPVAGQVQFLRITILNIGTGTLTVAGTVSGSVNPTLAQWKSMTVQTNGTIWMKIAAV